MKAPHDPGACVHYKYHPATWGYSGGCPEESECTHPGGSGDCNKEDCPYAKEGGKPYTCGDAYEDYCDQRYHEMMEVGNDEV